MNPDLIRQLPSMPLQSPTFPRGPYRFRNRQYMALPYRSSMDAIIEALPEPLEPDGDIVAVQWLDLPDGEGFGSYAAVAQVIPCLFKGEPCNYVHQMIVNNAPPLAAGREIWGYPMKFGDPSLQVKADTLNGELYYAGQLVALGTMTYKHMVSYQTHDDLIQALTRTQVTLKVIPGIDGRAEIAQLVGVNFQDVVVHGAWLGSGRLDMHASVNCPLSDLPVLSMRQASHLVTDMTLPYGRVLHDYLK
jgi:acetoacetate decarboxylase